MAIVDVCKAVYANAAPPLPSPGFLVVFTDKATRVVVGLSTDVEVAAGRMMGHWFSDYDVHESVSLDAAPTIGQPWPLVR